MRWIFRKIKNGIVRIFKIRKIILIPSLVIIVGLLSWGIVEFVGFYHYVEHDPEFCDSCHIMQDSWDKWAVSEHNGIECHDCHKQSLFASMGQLFNFVFRDVETIEKHAEVPDELCKNCHESGSEKWIQVANTQGHKLHSEEKGFQCTECHSKSVHSFVPIADICTQCHTDQHIASDSMANMHCDTCHNYLVESEGEEGFHPSRQSCLDCHEALADSTISWPTDAPMQFDCGTCHHPHDEFNQIVDCKSCHEPGLLHLNVAHKATTCITCHQPHGWQQSSRDVCLTCHTDRVNHQEGINCNVCHQFN